MDKTHGDLASGERIIVPLTKEEMIEAARGRIIEIQKEFRAAFELLGKYPKSVTFFGSARFTENNPHYIAAQNLAKRLSALGYSIVTGGGPGIMEAANRGAFENKGQSVGINIKLPREQMGNLYINDSMEVEYFFVRKVALSFAAEAYIFFPGGFGTLDEFFEILTLVQTRKIKHVPLILVGKDYWGALDQFILEQIYQKHKAVAPEDMRLYTITDDEDEVLEIVKNTPVVNSLKMHQ